MTIVVDVNTLSSVFNPKDTKYNDFSYVAQWIENNKGFLVYGGSKYKQELARMPRYLTLVTELRKRGKAIAILDAPVDIQEKFVQQATNGSDCDDPHIIALLGVSRCPLLCSRDTRSFQFIKNKTLFPKNAPSVRIYSGARNRDLLIRTDSGNLSNTC